MVCKNISANGPPIKKVVHSVETGPLVAKHRMKGKGSHLVRRMMCTPESVTTAWLSSPTCQKIGSIKLSFLTCRPKVASSKGFCICPGPNIPRSPPFLALLQSLNSLASSFQRCNSSVVNSDVPQRWPLLPQFWLYTQQVSEEPPPKNKGCFVFPNSSFSCSMPNSR